MKPIERIATLIDYYRTNISNFEKECELSNNSIGSAIRRKTSIKDETLNKVLKAFPEVSPEWLLTGEGNMLKVATNKQVLGETKLSKKLSDFSDLEIVDYIAANRERFKNLATFRIVVGLDH
ncbi:hypothetical protein [Zobellia sp. B3R18]|uniref:hypothetical protein n=1 Tax=Zobellia sp. B3R18 TaxID=2841568 RepID=UPI001C069E1A|nr:hypothetical protein [Zobellia sp. B3R18]MBU2974766.1 hypothetical protein [Zobellia sp. B3R18]